MHRVDHGEDEHPQEEGVDPRDGDHRGADSADAGRIGRRRPAGPRLRRGDDGCPVERQQGLKKPEGREPVAEAGDRPSLGDLERGAWDFRRFSLEDKEERQVSEARRRLRDS